MNNIDHIIQFRRLEKEVSTFTGMEVRQDWLHVTGSFRWSSQIHTHMHNRMLKHTLMNTSTHTHKISTPIHTNKQKTPQKIYKHQHTHTHTKTTLL